MCGFSISLAHMRKAIVMLAMLITFCSNHAIAQGQKWAVYTTDDYIYDVETDGEKLWAGVRGGLVSIDLKTNAKQVYLSSNSGLRGLGVKDVAVAPDGSKWFGSDNAGLLHYDNGEWEHYYEIEGGQTIRSADKIKFDNNGKIWFLASLSNNCHGCSILMSFDGTSFERHEFGSSPIFEPLWIRAFDVDKKGQVWVGLNDQLVRYNGGDVVEFYDSTNSPMVSGEIIAGIKTGPYGRVWFYTYSGIGVKIYKLEYGQIELVASYYSCQIEKLHVDNEGVLWVFFYPFNDSEPIVGKYDTHFSAQLVSDWPGLPPSVVTPRVINREDDGSFWLLSYQSDLLPKIYWYKDGVYKEFNTLITPTNQIDTWNIVQDCEGRYWIGTDNGFTIFDNQNWYQYYTSEFGIYGTRRLFAFDKNTCKVYISFHLNNSIETLLIEYDGAEFKQVDGTVPGWANDIVVDDDSNIWVSLGADGLAKYDGENWTIYDEFNSPLSGYVRRLALDKNNNLWMSVIGLGIIKHDGANGWEIFSGTNSPVGSNSYALYIDEANVVWTYNLGVVLKYDGQGWETIVMPTETGEVFNIQGDKNGDVWISASDGGVYMLNQYGFFKYTVSNSSIPYGNPYRIFVDRSNSKWFTHPSAVSVYNETGISGGVFSSPPSVSGIIFFDYNKNGVKDNNSYEPILKGEKVLLLPDSIYSTSSFGYYRFYPDTGNHTLIIDTTSSEFEVTSELEYHFNMADSSLEGLNFGMWTDNPEVSIFLDATQSLLRCNQETNVWITVCNQSLLPITGQLQFAFDPHLTFLGSNYQPSAVIGNTISFENVELLPSECRFYNLVFKVPGIELLGQELFSSATFKVEENGNVLAFESEGLRDSILCAFDPNDKTVFPTGDYYDNMSLLEDPLDFLIRFQNTGNDTAFNVVIRDTLDADLDWSTFELLSSSHPCEVTLDKHGVVTFTFRDILLLWESVDYLGSHGFVKYRVAPKSGLPDPTTITNTAYIYFDLNPPIVTNRTENILVEELPVTAVQEYKAPPDLRIFPNPSNGAVYIEVDDAMVGSTLAVFDLNGRVIHANRIVSRTQQITDLPAGFYFVRVADGTRSAVGKVVIMH
jgi:uncharacterized repeat protein (TIGR01451 family)